MKRVDADLVPFAQNNPSGYRFAFGTDTATDDINVNYNDNIKKGWGTTPNEFPEVEDFNAFAYTSGYLTAYLYQMGIAEWNNKQKYKQYSRVIGSDGKIYKAKTGTDLSPNVNNNPTSGTTNWEIDNQFDINSLTAKTTPIDSDNLAIQESGGLFKKISWANIKETLKTYFDTLYVSLTGNQTIAGVKTFTSSPIVPVPTTDFQSVPLRSTNITVNVGAGQAYTTINQALEYLTGFYTRYKKSGVIATINLKAGFVMAEQVLVSGIDLGWITIVGEDAETIITHTALTTAFNGTNYPAFGVDKGGTSPIIGQLFRFNVEKVGGNKHGLMTFGAGSSADVLSGKGFIGAGAQGIYSLFASTINANGANCSNAGTCGIVADAGSTINAYSANCSNAGTYGIYADAGSTINAYSAIIQNQTTGSARVGVAFGGTITAFNINTTGGTVPVFSQAVNTLTGNGIIYQ